MNYPQVRADHFGARRANASARGRRGFGNGKGLVRLRTAPVSRCDSPAEFTAAASETQKAWPEAGLHAADRA